MSTICKGTVDCGEAKVLYLAVWSTSCQYIQCDGTISVWWDNQCVMGYIQCDGTISVWWDIYNVMGQSVCDGTISVWWDIYNVMGQSVDNSSPGNSTLMVLILIHVPHNLFI